MAVRNINNIRMDVIGEQAINISIDIKFEVVKLV